MQHLRIAIAFALVTTFVSISSARAQDPAVDGEVLIVPGDSTILEPDGRSFRVRSFQALTKKVIARLGDRFQTITVWLTFDDAGDLFGAVSRTIRADVRGTGQRLFDDTALYGSKGVLRNLVSMKGMGLRAGDTKEQWLSTGTLAVWGQEYAHRWAMFMTVRDPRTGNVGELLLGRDCSHYNRFVETQGSVMDGYAWRANGDGTFTRGERAVRFSALDLYAMGLLAADEVPGFFFIDDVPGFTHGRCGAEYAATPFPSTTMIRGTKVDLGMDDVVFANGHRMALTDEPQDYWREAIVVLTGLNESVDAPRARALAARLNRARPWWDEWLQTATRQRLLNCTKITADCGDPRADVVAVGLDEARWRPDAQALSAEVTVANRGTASSPPATVTVDVLAGSERVARETSPVAALAAGAEEKVSVTVPAAAPCGAELLVDVSAQNGVHHSRRPQRVVVGMQPVWRDDFEDERGWTIDPDGDDTAASGAWERATPARADLKERVVQPAGASSGQRALVTGAAGGADDPAFVRGGRTTVQSPPIDVAAARAPKLRYRLSFAGGRLGTSAQRFDPSPQAHLTVLARLTDAAGNPVTEPVVVDRVAATLTAGWTTRVVSLAGKLAPTPAAPRVQLRFVAADEQPADGAVEAAIDDVEILSNRAECTPDAGAARDGGSRPATDGPAEVPAGGQGCACRAGGAARAPALALFGVVALVLARLRRRR